MKKNEVALVRDLSWLAFNARVLQEANDPNVSLYDRLRFLGIFSNNLDEFFRVRVATLNRMKQLGKSSKVKLEEDPVKTLKLIHTAVLEHQRAFDKIFNTIIGELASSKIFIKKETELTVEQCQYIQKLFTEKIRSYLVPLMVETIPQFPDLKDKSIYLACILGNDQNPVMQRYSLIEIPSDKIPRFYVLPTDNDEEHIILLEDVIRYNLPNLFGAFGYNQFLGYIVKMTRDAEFDLDSDEHTNIVSLLQKGIKGRKKGKATRFVFDKTIDSTLLEYLLKRIGVTKNDNLIPGGRIHNFKDFMDFPKSVFNNVPKRMDAFIHKDLLQPTRIMNVLKKKDILLNFPYHSFESIIDFLREAAIDPSVESIKMTCYRLAKDSKVANALVNAARNGKKVTVVLELRARFDEEANLNWKTKFEDEGVKIIMGVPNMKVHAKLCLIKTKTFNKVKYFGFISTGNFNEQSARVYSDQCLLTSQNAILSDVNKIFNALENQSKLSTLKDLKKLPVSPFTMRSNYLSLMDKEIAIAKQKKPARIIIKLNSLVDKILVNKIYEAAEAGVQVDLIVRGICCLLTEKKSFKKPIRAISIVDQYLEHTRVFVTMNSGNPTVYISSADWMVRNLDHRIEAACPITNKELKKEIIDILEIQLAGNVKSRVIDNLQQNKFVIKKEHEPVIRAQEKVGEYLLHKNVSTSL